MRLIYWLDRCPVTGRNREAVESIIPNVVQVKLLLDLENYIFVRDLETHFLITVPGIGGDK